MQNAGRTTGTRIPVTPAELESWRLAALGASVREGRVVSMAEYVRSAVAAQIARDDEQLLGEVAEEAAAAGR